jgi:hypothetical protein
MRVRLAGPRCHQAIIMWCVDVGPGLVGVLLAAWLAGRKAALLWPCPACQYDARYGIYPGQGQVTTGHAFVAAAAVRAAAFTRRMCMPLWLLHALVSCRCTWFGGSACIWWFQPRPDFACHDV